MILARTRSTLPIGIDIGAAGVRVVQIRRHADGIHIHRAFSWEAAAEDSACDRLRTLLKEIHFTGRRAIAGLSAPAVELLPLELPVAQDPRAAAELDKAARWEIHRLTTLKQEQLETAVWTLPASKRSFATAMGVAAPRAAIDARLAFCDRAGLACEKIDVGACAVAVLVWQLLGRPADVIWGVLDLGHEHTHLSICVEDVPVLVRSFDLGGRSWTQAIAAALNVSPAAAERHKCAWGITAPGDNRSSAGALGPHAAAGGGPAPNLAGEDPAPIANEGNSLPASPRSGPAPARVPESEVPVHAEGRPSPARAPGGLARISVECDRAPSGPARDAAPASLLANSACSGGPLAPLIRQALEPDLKRLIREIERSYEYVLQSYTPRAAADLVLVGGGALLHGLAPYMAAELGIDVHPVSRCPGPIARQLAQQLGAECLERCAQACGLSLQGATD